MTTNPRLQFVLISAPAERRRNIGGLAQRFRAAPASGAQPFAPANHAPRRVKPNPDHIAARRGLSLSVHAPTVKRGWSSVIETFNGNLLGT